MSDGSSTINADWSVFQPRPYLEDWYSKTTPEITATVGFLIRSYRSIAPAGRVIDFCSGPTMYQFIAAAPYVDAIEASDFLRTNLDELAFWRDDAANAFDWTYLIVEALRLEGNEHPTAAQIAERAAMTRAKLRALRQCDIRTEYPLGDDIRRVYDVVSHCYGADAVASSVDEWERYVTHTCNVLKPGGTVLMTIIKEATWYPSGGQVLPASSLNEQDLTRVLCAVGCLPESIVMETHCVDDAAEVGYSDVIFVRATLGDVKG